MDAYNNKGGILVRLERYEEALRCYDVAIKIKPNYYRIQHNKGIALSELERATRRP